jgi:LuxR family transcriptional regulator, transcriptional regulator of spore coat protein
VNTSLESPTAAPHAADLESALHRRHLEALSPRERIVLSHLTEDITLVELAALLWVSHNTIKSQVRSVYRKIDVSSRAEAVAWAKDAGLAED